MIIDKAYRDNRERCGKCSRLANPITDCECGVGFNDDFEIPEGVLFIEDEQKGRKFLKV